MSTSTDQDTRHSLQVGENGLEARGVSRGEARVQLATGDQKTPSQLLERL